MTTANDLLDSIKRAKAALTAADEGVSEAESLLRDRKKVREQARKKYDLAIEEALSEHRQPSLFNDDASSGPQTYHDDKSHVPAGERHGNSPPVEAPTWRAMAIDATGWGEELGEITFAALFSAPTVGDLADRLLAGETFGLDEYDLNNVYGLVEQISQDDEQPVTFAGIEAAVEATAFEVGAEPAPICSLQLERAIHEANKGEPKPVTKLADLDNFPDAVADALLVKGISTVETLLESMEGKAYLGPEVPLRNRLVAFLVASDSDIKIRQAEHAAQAVAEFVEKPKRFVVEAGNELDEDGREVWHVVDTSKKKPHERYCDEFPTEAEAVAAAERYEESADNAPPEPKPAKKSKRKAVNK